MSIASEIQRLQGAKDDIKIAIQAKGVTVPASAKLDTYDTYIAQIDGGGGGSTAEEKTVVFYDYDGTVVTSYTPTEFASLSAMPNNPTHTELIAQGWNWNLSDAKTYVAEYGGLNIGQMYTTASGATEIDIKLDLEEELAIRLYLCLNGSGTVDWGDNSTVTAISGSSLSTSLAIEHTYSSVGDYTISIFISSGSAYLGYYSNNSRNRALIYRERYDTLQRSGVSAIRIGDNITRLEGYCFYQFTHLRTITIPSTVSFSNFSCQFALCYSLQYVALPLTRQNLPSYAFHYCVSLKHISLGGANPSSYCFEFCYSLEECYLNSNLTTLGSNMFRGCCNLRKICFSKSLIRLDSYVFSETIIDTVSIPSTVTIIGSNCFTGCRALKSISYSGTPTYFQTYVFSGCCSLSDVVNFTPTTLLDSFGNIFNNCYALEFFKLPDGTTKIPSGAFSNCYSLKEVDIPDTVTIVDGSAFSNCYSLKSIMLPSSVTTIGSSCFYNCNSLVSVNIPQNVTNLYTYTFYQCYMLTEIILPDNITALPNYLFYNCYSLTTITIPENVTSVGTYVFYQCSKIMSFYFLPTTPPTLANKNAFSSTNSNSIIYVPHGSLTAYQTASNWSNYASRMVEMPA